MVVGRQPSRSRKAPLDPLADGETPGVGAEGSDAADDLAPGNQRQFRPGQLTVWACSTSRSSSSSSTRPRQRSWPVARFLLVVKRYLENPLTIALA
jgi:hypothetical protein